VQVKREARDGEICAKRFLVRYNSHFRRGPMTVRVVQWW
jgi:hypothetical protein